MGRKMDQDQKTSGVFSHMQREQLGESPQHSPGTLPSDVQPLASVSMIPAMAETFSPVDRGTRRVSARLCPKGLEMMQNRNLGVGWKIGPYLTPSLPVHLP